MCSTNEIKTLIYLTRILYYNYSLYFLLYMFTIYTKLYKRKRQFKLQTISNKLFYKIIHQNERYKFCDINNTVLINRSLLYDKESFITIKGANFTKNAVILSSDLIPEDLLITSNVSRFNLKLNEPDSVARLHKLDATKIAFASEIVVSLINIPVEIDYFGIDSILRHFFTKPKLIHTGDVIEVCMEEYGKQVYYSGNKSNMCESVYFKCNKISLEGTEVEGGFLCSTSQTTLKQTGNIEGFLPKKFTTLRRLNNDCLSLSSCNLSDFEVPLCPYGLENRLESLLKALKPFLSKKKLNLDPVFLLQGSKGCGKDVLLSTLASNLGIFYYKVTTFEISANVYAQYETKLRNVLFNAKTCTPCLLAIHGFENFGKNNEGQYDERIMGYFVNELRTLFKNNTHPVLLFCCSNEKSVPVALKRAFLQTFAISAPDDEERLKILQWLMDLNGLKTGIDLDQIANKTHGFLLEDLRLLVSHASSFNCAKNKRKNGEARRVLSDEDFNSALDLMQANYNESLGAPKVPKVQWDDVGGLKDVKEEIIKTINLPLKHPELLARSGLKRSGVLLFGPPGTGKTLIAKAVATECNLCFLSVKGPELLNMYIGQSEENIREVFERARAASPCIIFFDELDSLAPNRGVSGDSGGVMDRVVSQLLAEMDGLTESATVFVIGATNRPDLIDPALLRPGRFDKLLYVGPCTDNKSKLSVLKALTRKFNFEKGLDLKEVVEVCPKNISGADFYGICSSAWNSAVTKLVNAIESGAAESPEKLSHENVLVSLDDFRSAIKNVKPSISAEDLLYFEKLKRELGSNT